MRRAVDFGKIYIAFYLFVAGADISSSFIDDIERFSIALERKLANIKFAGKTNIKIHYVVD